MKRGESDGSVVPVKAGNSAGGKGVTHDSAARMMNVNYFYRSTTIIIPVLFTHLRIAP